MSTTKGNWLFSLLWINFAVALVVFIRVIVKPDHQWAGHPL